ERELAERALQFLCGCGSGYPEHLVVVTLLRHLHSPDRQPSARPATSNVRTSEPLSILQINRQARQAREGIVLPPKTRRGVAWLAVKQFRTWRRFSFRRRRRMSTGCRRCGRPSLPGAGLRP